MSIFVSPVAPGPTSMSFITPVCKVHLRDCSLSLSLSLVRVYYQIRVLPRTAAPRTTAQELGALFTFVPAPAIAGDAMRFPCVSVRPPASMMPVLLMCLCLLSQASHAGIQSGVQSGVQSGGQAGG